MKLQLANTAGINQFTAHGEGYVAVNNERHSGNLIVLPASIITGWTSATAATLTPGDLQGLLGLGAGIVLLGTGSRLRLPPPQWLKPFAQAGIGLEVMDLPAACRTYNILASEGRPVAAALLFD
ncbi:MAG: MTH938/NDUFAF3 family protein [Betaproteobacteria bacterium]|nr:MTH938/NDUFAF3 family protein [Betaproteobacteria bacterium]MCL2886852.1 MTH938/NDUFAF3 family protein [Betaproteobacteria bacterium]